MKWFNGTIPEAIQSAKANKVIFVVYITGTDDVSKEMDATWESPSVSSLCDEEGFVALKLEAQSDASAQFSAIYPVVCVPSTYFISNTGIPLEAAGGHLEADKFVDKIKAAVKMHKEQIGEVSNPPSTAADTGPAVPPGGNTEETTSSSTDDTTPSPQNLPAETSGGVDVSGVSDEETGIPASTEPSTSDAAEAGTLEDRVQRARELMRLKKEEKERQKKEEEKQKEKERIQVGKNMGHLRQNRDEMEAREAKEQMKKDREEERKARERVREQIARDRAERSAKFQKEKEDREKARQSASEAKAAAQQEAAAQAARVRSETARIQFRLPDGSSITEQFPSSDTLDSARQFLLQEISDRYGNPRLTTTYPRREFTEDDMSQTLLDLELAPSAIIVVLPGHKGTVSRSSETSGGDGFLMVILGPLIALWNFIYNFLFGAPSQPQGSYNRNSPPAQPQADSSQTGERQSRPKSSYGLRSRKDGNIHRLSNNDDDDDMATWNGNSTQQM